jgi:signal transduction histidine kinase
MTTGLPDKSVSSHDAAMVASVATSATLSQRLSVLNHLLAISIEDVDLDQQLTRALDEILEIPWLPTESKGCIMAAVEGSRVLRMAAHRGMDADIVARCATVPFGRCVCGHTAERQEITFIDFSIAPAADTSCKVPSGHYCLPIRARGRLLGVLSIYLLPGYNRSPQEETFLVAVTNVLAAMIELRWNKDRTHALLEINKTMNQHLIGLQEEEYRRLARELHDEMGQTLTAIHTDAALIAKHAEGQLEVISRSAEAIRSAVEHLFGVTRSMIHRLRPSILDDLGLAAALETIVSEWQVRRPGLPCRLTLEGEIDELGEGINITVFRLVQEGLTNVLRHAAASRVHVAVSCQRSRDGVVQVLVEDDGRGMEIKGVLTSGRRFGLRGMRERVEGIGGRLDIDSAPGKGLRLRATIPLTTTAAQP